MRHWIAVALSLVIPAAGCTSATGPDDLGAGSVGSTAVPASGDDTISDDPGPAEPPPAEPLPAEPLPTGTARDFGPAPEAPEGPLDPMTEAAVEQVFGRYVADVILDDGLRDAIATIGASGDPRTAWWLTDALRVTSSRDLAAEIAAAYEELTGVAIDPVRGWPDAVDHLIAWDVPAPPDYLRYKRLVYLSIDPRWEPLLAEDGDVDWRWVSWGGVLIDDRDYDTTDAPCRCIPAVDNPAVTDVAGGDEWLDDDSIVFGVEIDGEARAYPRSVMEVREMVNDSLGGRDFAMPYCTLCGAAQVFFTDEVEGFGRPVLRTSGLLSRSNKVMYDVRTESVFDTFLGAAVTGPLWEAGVALPQQSVVTTSWGEWKTSHPETTVVAIAEALGRPDSDLRNTRDADGPIFPIGTVDDRLALQEDVLGVVADDGTAVAFHVPSAIEALERGEAISMRGITLILDGGGVRAVDDAGSDAGGHQAFWFAWSQFHPDTELWPEG